VRHIYYHFRDLNWMIVGIDAIGSVGFHPLRPWLLSVSGSRHFENLSDGSDSSDASSLDDKICIGNSANAGMALDRQTKGTTVTRKRRAPQPVTLDGSISVWDFTDKRNRDSVDM